MAKVALVTDSTASIPQDLVDSLNIHVAPQVLIWGNITLLDGIDIQPDEFYQRLKEAKEMPTTSQASPQAFEVIFRNLLDEGYQVLAVLVSRQLSGTIASAEQAKDLFPGAPIEIVDSESVAMAMGFQVLAAARAAQQGASLQECKQLVEKARQHTGVIFAVDTLEFLHRGGRIGGGVRLLGTAINLKPILEVTGGHVETVDKVRTRKKSLARLIELMCERINGNHPLRLATLHANAPEEARELLEQASLQLEPAEVVFSSVSPVVGNHAGPGTVGLAYMAGM